MSEQPKNDHLGDELPKKKDSLPRRGFLKGVFGVTVAALTGAGLAQTARGSGMSNEGKNQGSLAETEPQSVIVFDGDPASEAGQALGDGGFRYMTEPKKILFGPYLRDFDQPDMAKIGFDNSTLRVTVGGEGDVIVGATDHKMTGSDFGFHEATAELPYTFDIYWPGLTEQEDGQFDGYGLEIIVMRLDDSALPQAQITNIKIEKLGDGNLLNE